MTVPSRLQRSRFSMNRRFGVPPSGGSNCSHRLEPELPAVGGFIVPMHGHKTVEAFHEPRLVWSPAFRRLERLGPAEAGTPSRQRLHGPNACAKTKGGFP